MDIFSHSYSAILTTVIVIFPVFCLFLAWLKSKNGKRFAPEARGSWPILGHLHLLSGPEPLHQVFGNMADKCGPIFTVKMGARRALVVSNWETAKDCLSTNDKAFVNRPRTVATKVLGYNNRFCDFSSYESCCKMRKFVTHELLSGHRLDMSKHVQESEIKFSIKELYQVWEENQNQSDKVLVEMRKWFSDLTLNIILKVLIGKRISSSKMNVLKEFFELSGKFVIADAFPLLRWLDIGGDERLLNKVRKQLDEITEECLIEYKQKRASGESKIEEDFMDVMMSSITDGEDQQDVDTIIKDLWPGLAFAGADSSSGTLTWALALLLNNPNALKKAQEELDLHVGKGKLVEPKDTKNLVYLQAIIKETLRLYPAAPLSLPHESIEDCTVNGYHIPAGTILFINLYKIHRDSCIWSNPYEFQPERFLTTCKKFDIRGQNFELIPFSSGRRMCPGISFALPVLQLTLANLLHGFELAIPLVEPTDMREAKGIAIHKATHLQVSISPRHPAFCYDLK